jgi:hypothetical protein
MKKQSENESMNLSRRHFLRSVVLGGAGLMGGMALIAPIAETSTDHDSASQHSRAFSAHATIDIASGKMPADPPAYAAVPETRQT